MATENAVAGQTRPAGL